MDVSEFSYVWTTQRDGYVLVASEYEYAIVNKKEQTMLCISDDEVGDSYAFLMDSGLSDEAKELIAHVNAERLLHV